MNNERSNDSKKFNPDFVMNWSVHKAAVEFGVSRETIIRGLRRLDVEVGRRTTFTTKQIVSSIYGDADFERTRLLRADADIREMERLEKENDLVKLSEVEKMLVDYVAIPVRNLLISAPTTLDQRVNPADPELAREALQRWVDDSLKLLREKLPTQSKK
jgi:phage terminase Nu1 subunit (DNA packaging protein)